MSQRNKNNKNKQPASSPKITSLNKENNNNNNNTNTDLTNNINNNSNSTPNIETTNNENNNSNSNSSNSNKDGNNNNNNSSNSEKKSSHVPPIDHFLESLNLCRREAPKDGACMFRCVSESMYGTQECHQTLRKHCVSYLSENREFFEPFASAQLPWEHYIFEMSKIETWGGEVELQALSLMLKRNFTIYSEIGPPKNRVCTINKIDNGFPHIIELAFSGGNHYDVVYKKDILNSGSLCQDIVYDLIHLVIEMKTGNPAYLERVSGEWTNLSYKWWIKSASQREVKDRKMAKKMKDQGPVKTVFDFPLPPHYKKGENDIPFTTVESRKNKRKKKPENNKTNDSPTPFQIQVNVNKEGGGMLNIELSEEEKELQAALERIRLQEEQELIKDHFPTLAPTKTKKEEDFLDTRYVELEKFRVLQEKEKEKKKDQKAKSPAIVGDNSINNNNDNNNNNNNNNSNTEKNNSTTDENSNGGDGDNQVSSMDKTSTPLTPPATSGSSSTPLPHVQHYTFGVKVPKSVEKPKTPQHNHTDHNYNKSSGRDRDKDKSNYRSNNRDRDRDNVEGGSKGSVRLCFVCSQPGHFAANCPQRKYPKPAQKPA